MDIKIIEQLAQVMKNNELTKLEVSEEGFSVKLEQNPAAEAAANRAEQPQKQAAAPFVSPAPKAEGTLVLSPTVGVFYSAPSPESKDFVAVGDRVKKGDVLCIIEAMKLMNEIPAELDGTITEICVSNGQVVEFNQPLFRIG